MSAALGQRGSRWRRNGWFVLTLLVVPAICFSFVALIASIPLPNEDAARRTCDEAVHNLLTTTDMVELQRAQILVRRLNCGVRRRLPL
jgi:hypothetical protein